MINSKIKISDKIILLSHCPQIWGNFGEENNLKPPRTAAQHCMEGVGESFISPFLSWQNFRQVI